MPVRERPNPPHLVGWSSSSLIVTLGRLFSITLLSTFLDEMRLHSDDKPYFQAMHRLRRDDQFIGFHAT